MTKRFLKLLIVILLICLFYSSIGLTSAQEPDPTAGDKYSREESENNYSYRIALPLIGSYKPVNLVSLISDITVQTIIENGTVFPNNVTWLRTAIGDLTNNGNLDLVITKGGEQYRAGAAVFQRSGGEWDNGTMLSGPTQHNANFPLVAPIRNDGQNWLVYTEHRIGNSGEWLRAHRYNGTTLVENRDIASRTAWPGWMAANTGDLDGDGNLEVWYVELYGNFPSPTFHLQRRVWDPATGSYPGLEIKDGKDSFDPPVRPRIGDFLGNSTQSLIWVPRRNQIDLVTFTPGSGVHDHTSKLIFTAPRGNIMDIDAGEFDGNPGADFAVVTSEAAYLVSGGTFEVTEIASDINEDIRAIRMGDLDGDGFDEVYAAGRSGGIYGYDSDAGWRQIAVHPDAMWTDGVTARWEGTIQDEVLFGGPVGGRTFRVVSLTAERFNAHPNVDAGSDQIVNEGDIVTLPPATFNDPDGDEHHVATIDWGDGTIEPGLINESGGSGTITGSHIFSDNSIYTVKVIVCDEDEACGEDSFIAIVHNVAPKVDAGSDVTIYRNDPVTVSGIWTDPAEDLDNPYTWNLDLDGDSLSDNTGSAHYGAIISETASFTSEGKYTLTFEVTDKDGGTGSDSLEIEVLNRPPVCSDAIPSIDELWSPNHMFVTVDVLGLTDPEGDSISVTIDSIFQDEPVDSYGDGSFTPDGQGIGTSAAELRVERAGGGNGRFYHVSFTADDGHGATCSGKVLVAVPKSKSPYQTPIDEGPLYDSTEVGEFIQ